MRILFLSYKFLILSIVALTLLCCSSQEDDNEETPFESIEITFDEDFAIDCGELWMVDGVSLSISPFTADEIDPNGPGSSRIDTCPSFSFIPSGNGNASLLLAPAAFEIDFSALTGFSRITIEVDDDASGMRANLYEGATIVETQTVLVPGSERKNLVFDIISRDATRVRLWSFEGFIFRIIIE